MRMLITSAAAKLPGDLNETIHCLRVHKSCPPTRAFVRVQLNSCPYLRFSFYAPLALNAMHSHHKNLGFADFRLLLFQPLFIALYTRSFDASTSERTLIAAPLRGND